MKVDYGIEIFLFWLEIAKKQYFFYNTLIDFIDFLIMLHFS